MAYIINRFSGVQLVVLEDGTLNTTTSLGLVGRNYTGYGEIQNENFLFLLENFANANPPARPLSGQTWFNSQTKNLNVYDGTEWKSVGSAEVSSISPLEAQGALWLKSDTQQLYVYNDGWQIIGPEAVIGFNTTRTRSRSIRDTSGVSHPILEILVNGQVIAVTSTDEFSILPEDSPAGFSTLSKGINLSTVSDISGKVYNLIGDLKGNSQSTTRLINPRKINGIDFDGQSDITIKSSTTNSLLKGTYLLGDNFDGSSTTTWSVDATPSNTIGKIVARNSQGGFSAGVINATFVGDLSGNVTTQTGTSYFNRIEANEFVGATLTGNAFSSTKLQTARQINGVPFDGTANITVTANAETLSGLVLNSTVVSSNLSSVGILNNLKITDIGLIVGNNNGLRLFADGSENPIIKSQISGKSLSLRANDSTQLNSEATVDLIPSNLSLLLGGLSIPSLSPANDLSINLGIATKRWNNVFANLLIGTATTAQYADLAENYLADQNYESGTVLEFGGQNEVTVASYETKKIAGVVSTNPAHLMNSKLEGNYVTAVALQGRVPCKVSGKIKKGDMLISAGNGYAKSCENPEIGAVIGKSLCDFDGDFGTVEVVVGRI